MKKIVFFLSLVALSLSSCHKSDFSLEGSLANGAGKCLYIEELSPDGPVFLDSIHLDNEGHFTYEGMLPYQTFFNLHTNEADYVVLLPDKGETISIKGDYRSLQCTYEVTGSTGSSLLWQIQDYTNYGIERLTELVAMDRANRERCGSDTAMYRLAKQQTDSVFREANAEQTEYISKFIQDNKGSLATLIALYKQFNQHDLIAPEVNFDYYELVLEGLQDNHPDNPHTIHFKNSVENLRHYYGKPKQALDLSFDEE